MLDCFLGLADGEAPAAEEAVTTGALLLPPLLPLAAVAPLALLPRPLPRPLELAAAVGGAAGIPNSSSSSSSETAKSLLLLPEFPLLGRSVALSISFASAVSFTFWAWRSALEKW